MNGTCLFFSVKSNAKLETVSYYSNSTKQAKSHEDKFYVMTML